MATKPKPVQLTWERIHHAIAVLHEPVPTTDPGALPDRTDSPGEHWRVWKGQWMPLWPYGFSLAMAWRLVPADETERYEFLASEPFLRRLGALGYGIWALEQSVAARELTLAWLEWKTGQRIEVKDDE